MALAISFWVLPFRIGALAKYRCERGYKMVGEALATCTDSGQWSGSIPECVCEYWNFF